MPEEARIGMSVLIWIINFGYLLYAVKCYVHEYYRDELKKRKVRQRTRGKTEFKAQELEDIQFNLQELAAKAAHEDAMDKLENKNIKKWKIHPISTKEEPEEEEQEEQEEQENVEVVVAKVE